MTDPIHIHPADTPEQARERHARIEKRLEELGTDEVRRFSETGGLPTQWDSIIRSWLNGDKLKPEEAK